MPKLNQLALRIRSLPDAELERARIAVVLRVNQDARDVAAGLTAVFNQAKYIDAIAMSSVRIITVLNDAVSFSITQAKSLKKLIQRDKFGSEVKISEHLENLKNKKQSVETQRNNVWAKVQSEIQPVQTVLNIAAKLKLTSVAALEAAITTFKNATSLPPSSMADKESVVSARKECKTAIENSGLTGNVKKLLEGAINANGDPKLLLEDDVKQFLEDHPELWGSLKLKLA